jgi:lysozyme family protein
VTPNEIIDALIRREGGFVDHKDDKGKATKYGITQATLAEWLGRPASVDDVKALTEHEAREIYREEYITRPGFLGIENEAVRALAVDCAVNHLVPR